MKAYFQKLIINESTPESILQPLYVDRIIMFLIHKWSSPEKKRASTASRVWRMDE